MFRSPKPLLRARSIAIVGASDRARWPVSIYYNLTSTKAKVKILPINPSRDEVWGLPCYPNFGSLPTVPDLALIIIPATHVLASLEEGSQHGLKAALVYASGIGEGTDPEFHQRGLALKHLCDRTGLVACGPNCMGTVSVKEKLFLYPNPDFNLSKPGPVAGVFQSGGTLQHWCRVAAERGVRFSYMVSSGNELSLDTADYINFFVDDPKTKIIILMIEGIRRTDAFKAAAERALLAGKPILAVKVGQTEEARNSAKSHTGAIAGDYDVFAALCEQYGIVLCSTLDDMVETTLAFQLERLPKGNSMAFISNSGGVVDLLHDHAAQENAKLASYSKKTIRNVRNLVGPDMPMQNPMDCGQAGFADPKNYMRVCEAVASDKGVHMLAFEARTPNREGERSALPLKDLKKGTNVPVFAFNRMEYTMNEVGRLYQEQTGIPHLQSMPETIRAMKALAFYAVRKGKLVPKYPLPKGKKRNLQVGMIEKVLSLYGISSPVSRYAKTADEAAKSAKKIGFPVALKVISEEISHKTEVGGVMLGLNTQAEVRKGVDILRKRIKENNQDPNLLGFLLQEMVEGVEVIVGVREDPLYGPVLVVGTGGIFVELVRDTAFCMLPVSKAKATLLIKDLSINKLIKGFRGSKPADREALIDAICGLSKFYLDHRPWLSDLEINPLIIRENGKGVRAVDIRFHLHDK